MKEKKRLLVSLANDNYLKTQEYVLQVKSQESLQK